MSSIQHPLRELCKNHFVRVRLLMVYKFHLRGPTLSKFEPSFIGRFTDKSNLVIAADEMNMVPQHGVTCSKTSNVVDLSDSIKLLFLESE